MTFETNWNFSETYIPAIKKILRSNAMHIVDISIASPEDDMKHATDLKVTITSGNIAVRIRRSSYQFRDLTIRSYKNGNRTELDKLRDGYGDWYLYAWKNKDRTCLSEYILVDLTIARPLFFTALPEKTNTDGSKFVVIAIQELQKYGAIKAHKIIQE